MSQFSTMSEMYIFLASFLISSALDADYAMVMDYVDGEYHNFYKILLTI